MTMLGIIGFDADDTLWENEVHYRLTEERFTGFLADYAEQGHLSERLLAAERRNLGRYGYGIKGFTLSMIETAIEVTNGRVPAHVIQQILEAGRELHNHPTPLLPGVQDTLGTLAASYPLALITKGDLFDQERKIAQSGLADMFQVVEIVSEKTPAVYSRIFTPFGGAMMVGNSLKSDVIPALEAGAWGVHVPSSIEWEMESAPTPVNAPRFNMIENLAELPSLIDRIGDTTWAK